VENNPVKHRDPLGLFLTPPAIGCSTVDKYRIWEAVNKAAEAGKTCLACSDRDKFQAKVKDLTIICDNYDVCRRPSVGVMCGCVPSLGVGKEIYITPEGLNNPACGCLAATVLHETTHLIGYVESAARKAEKACFGKSC
jgi:hypothetical protein